MRRAGWLAVGCLLAGCGLQAGPTLSSAAADRASATRVGGVTLMPVRDEQRFLAIAGSDVQHAPIMAVAAYSGTLDAQVLQEFRRRYGYMDFVVIQQHDAGGYPSGRVYAYQGDSTGSNGALMAAASGAECTVTDEKGQVTYHGALFDRNDFVAFAPKKTVTSADGHHTAQLLAASYPAANYLIATDTTTGATSRWQAGSRTGDLYLDAAWLPGGQLLTVEGTSKDELVYQEHEREWYVTTVLGVEQVQQDAEAAHYELDPNHLPLISGVVFERGGITYKGTLTLTTGKKVVRTWHGALSVGTDGNVTCTDRHLVP